MPVPLCLARASSMWSRKPMPVAISLAPPSRSQVAVMSVSRVLRATVAVRGMAAAYPSR